MLIGAMSGTSADGVDAALVRITGTGMDMRAELLHVVESSYPTDLRARVQTLRQRGETQLSELASLGRDVSVAYVNVVRQLLEQSNVSPDDVTAIAAHGQTLFHAPPLSIQWMDPALVAQQTGIDVISDFRRADLAVGGQGAPLVPFADWILFRSNTETRVILNIGGIANVTILPKASTLDQVIGFDTGPGNCVSDWLMDQDYFKKSPPKSTDGPAMIEIWKRMPLALQSHFGKHDSASPTAISDSLATAALWVGWSIREAIGAYNPDTLVVAGGGVRNAGIMQFLNQDKWGLEIITTDSLGVPTQAREAVAFAILGCATIDRVCANVTRVTGASRPVILGAVYPA